MLRVSLTPLPVKDSYALRPADLLSQAILGNRPESYRQLLGNVRRSEEHTSELQSQSNLVCRLLLEKKKQYHQFGTANAVLSNSDASSTLDKNHPVTYIAVLVRAKWMSSPRRAPDYVWRLPFFSTVR